jgi:hypothetical protein
MVLLNTGMEVNLWPERNKHKVIFNLRVFCVHILNAVCYAMSSFRPFTSNETLKMFYDALFHSIVKYIKPLNTELNPM